MYFKINRTSFFYNELNFFVVFRKYSEAVSKLTKSNVQVSFIYREMYFVRLFLSILLLRKISTVSLKFKIGKNFTEKKTFFRSPPTIAALSTISTLTPSNAVVTPNS